MASGQFCTTRLYNIFAGNVEGKRAGERLWLFPVSGAFFVNRHHSLNQEAVGPSVNRDHNIWTTQKRKMCRAAVVRLCMISISIAISFLTTRCYSTSHSGPLMCQESNTKTPGSHFRLHWDTMDTGRCQQLTIVLLFFCPCVGAYCAYESCRRRCSSALSAACRSPLLSA